MARPRKPNRTTMIRATITIAWPRCRPADIDATSVLRCIRGGCRDDEGAASELLEERREGDEVVADRHLQGRVVVGRIGCAAGSCVEGPSLASGRVLQGGRQGLNCGRRIRLRDVDPALVGRRVGSGDGPVRTGVGQRDVDGMLPDGRLHVGVRGELRRGTNGGPGTLVHCLVESHVYVDHPPEVDDPEKEQQKERGDQGELGHCLGSLSSRTMLRRAAHVGKPPTAMWTLATICTAPTSAPCMKPEAKPKFMTRI